MGFPYIGFGVVVEGKVFLTFHIHCTFSHLNVILDNAQLQRLKALHGIGEQPQLRVTQIVHHRVLWVAMATQGLSKGSLIDSAQLFAREGLWLSMGTGTGILRAAATRNNNHYCNMLIHNAFIQLYPIK